MTTVRDQLKELGFYSGVVDTGRRDGVLFEVTNSPASKERLEAAGKRWREIRAKDLTRHGRYWVDRGSGALYVETPGDPLMADDRGSTDLFAVVDGRLVFLQRSGGPATLADLEAGEAAARTREATDEKARAAGLQKQPQVAVWFGQSSGLAPVSLREVVRGFERSGGRVALDAGGRLQITAPERLTGDSFAAVMEGELRQQLAAQAEVIVHCREIVEAALKARGGATTALADLLPAGSVTVTGGVA